MGVEKFHNDANAFPGSGITTHHVMREDVAGNSFQARIFGNETWLASCRGDEDFASTQHAVVVMQEVRIKDMRSPK